MSLLASNGVTSYAADVVAVVILTVFAIASVAVLIMFLCRYADGGKIKRKKSALAVILSVAFVVRLVLTFCVRGYRADYKLFTDMFDSLSKNGLDGYYTGDASVVLYPIVYFIYLIFGGFSNVTGLSVFPLGAQFMVKLPLIIADLITAYIVYKIACKYFNDGIGLSLAAFIGVSPIFLIGSTVWVTPIVITVMFIAVAFYFLACKKYAPTIAFAMLAAFSSKEGIYIFPIVCVFSVFHFVRAVINVKNNNVRGKAVFAPDTVAIVTVPVSLVLSFVGVYILGFFMTASYSFDPFKYIYEFLIAPLTSWSYFTYNGLSIYSIFVRNGVEHGARFPMWVFVCVFTLVICVVTCVVYFTKRNRATLVLLAAYALLTMQVYYPSSSAIGMESVLAVLVIAYALVRDKRILHVLFAVGIVFVINSLSTLAVPGFLGNADDHLFTKLESFPNAPAFTGGLSAITIVCSVIAFIAHIYFTVVTISVGMTGNKKLLGKRDGFGSSLAEYFRIDRRR